MARPRTGLTRRQALAGLGAAGGFGLLPDVSTPTAAAQIPADFRLPDEDVPINGKAGPGFESFDDAMLAIMDRHGIPGAALAIARQGKLLFAKGYGWANLETSDPIRPDTLFGLASLSKPFTAVAV